MEKIRKPFQGVFNIIRFNWHFYVSAFVLMLFIFFLADYFYKPIQIYLYIFCVLAIVTTCISLVVSFYVYDFSGLYNFKWIRNKDDEGLILNINAGFDETSYLLKERFKNCELIVFDFYNPIKHTEISIKRARRAYPPFPGTKQIETYNLQLPDNSADKIFVILSAHEIRNQKERIIFFKELSRVIKPRGQIFIIEHLRNVANFLAYNIGSFHFYSRQSWYNTFESSNLSIKKEIKLTLFISAFILEKNGNTF